MTQVTKNAAVDAALKQMSKYQRKIPQDKKDKLIVIDYSIPSNKKRLFVVQLTEDSYVITRSHHVAHGVSSSDPKDRAKAIKFSNVPESLASSLGAMVTDQPYKGAHGYSMRIVGLEEGINNNVMRRAIVFHAAQYVTDAFIAAQGRCGQSHGCPALDPAVTKAFIDEFKFGTFVYAYYK